MIHKMIYILIYNEFSYTYSLLYYCVFYQQTSLIKTTKVWKPHCGSSKSQLQQRQFTFNLKKITLKFNDFKYEFQLYLAMQPYLVEANSSQILMMKMYYY